MSNFIDLTGMKFGRLEVVSRAENYEKYSNSHKRVLKYARWNCVCDCGKVTVVLATDLKSKSQVSCGCLNREMIKFSKTTHNKSSSKEYSAWLSAKDRCFNSNIERYGLYGGRGITMQDTWINDFMAFYNHIGDCPDPSYSLDRIDTNKNYEEGNVRWADRYQQSQNTRRIKCGNKYKYVRFVDKIGKYKTVFSFYNKQYTAGYFSDERDAAVAIYKLYKEVTGGYPKYCDEDLHELGLIKLEITI